MEEDAELRSLIEATPDRFLIIVPIPSSVGWQTMADFTDHVALEKERFETCGIEKGMDWN